MSVPGGTSPTRKCRKAHSFESDLCTSSSTSGTDICVEALEGESLFSPLEPFPLMELSGHHSLSASPLSSLLNFGFLSMAMHKHINITLINEK